MNKKKSAFVTTIIFVMLVLIDLGLFRLYFTGFVILTGLLALYGFIRSFMDFKGWLVQEDTIAPLEMLDAPKSRFYDWQQDTAEAEDQPSDDASEVSVTSDTSVESILDEFRSGNSGGSHPVFK